MFRWLLRLARRNPMTIICWALAALYWDSPDMRYALLVNGLAWIPLQLGLSGMMGALERPRAGPIQWRWIVFQLLIAGGFAYACVMGSLQAEPDKAPPVGMALLLGMIAAFAITRLIGMAGGLIAKLGRHVGAPPMPAGLLLHRPTAIPAVSLSAATPPAEYRAGRSAKY